MGTARRKGGEAGTLITSKVNVCSSNQSHTGRVLLRLAVSPRSPHIRLIADSDLWSGVGKDSCMSKTAAGLREKAEASRQMANMTDDAKRRALWDQRAREWDRLATKAGERSPSRAR